MSAIVSLAQTMASAIQTHISLGRQRRVYEAQARQAMAESRAEQAEITRRARYIQGASTARAGASGAVDSPSALDVLIANAQEIGMDVSKAGYQGEMAAWGFTEAAAEAKWAQKYNMLTGGLAGAGHAAQIAQQWSQKQPSGNRETWFTNQSWGPGGAGLGGSYPGTGATGLSGSFGGGGSSGGGYPQVGEQIGGFGDF